MKTYVQISRLYRWQQSWKIHYFYSLNLATGLCFHSLEFEQGSSNCTARFRYSVCVCVFASCWGLQYPGCPEFHREAIEGGGLPSVGFLVSYKKYGKPKAVRSNRSFQLPSRRKSPPVTLKLWLGFLYWPLCFSEKWVTTVPLLWKFIKNS